MENEKKIIKKLKVSMVLENENNATIAHEFAQECCFDLNNMSDRSEIFTQLKNTFGEFINTLLADYFYADYGYNCCDDDANNDDSDDE